MTTVGVVGAGMAGLRTAEALRSEGFEGRIVLVGNESHPPYDRPPLSKGFLTGEIDQATITFRTAQELAQAGIEFLTAAAVHLEPGDHRIVADGHVVEYERAVLATGAAARPVPGLPHDRQPLLLRTVDDALALRERLACSRSVVVIGGGLIGCEIVATARARGLEVTLVEPADTLMIRSLGPRLGVLCEELHRARGVRVRTGTAVVDLVERDPGWQVELSTGERLAADLVVGGVGADPVTSCLAGSGITVDDGVLCDPTLTTSDPDVVAVGDVARYRRPDGRLVRTEQWLNAVEQARHVAANILLPHEERAPFRGSDYFWTQQFGYMIQGVGSVSEAAISLTDHDPAEHHFLASAVRDGRTAGVFACGFPRQFALARRAYSAQTSREGVSS